MIVLVVTAPFADHQRGDEIRDPAAIQAVYDAGLDKHVVRRAEPDPARGPSKKADPAA